MAKGSCLCGNVKYEYTGDPVQKVICHCLTCRKITGSTNTVCLIVPSAHFKFLSSDNSFNSLKHFTTKHETGMELEISFCSGCGSSLCKEPQGEANQGVKIVFAGTLDDNNAHALDTSKPQAELWVKYRTSWLTMVDGAAQMQGFE